MSKYQYLEDYLREIKTGEWRASFQTIEQIIGAELPASARAYPAWWSNNPSNNVMTKFWLNAGWRTEKLDIPSEKVTFCRKMSSKKPSQFAEGETNWTSKSSASKKSGEFIVLQGVSGEVLRTLRRRASANQRQLEDEIIAIIENEVGRGDRLSRIEAIRKAMPADLHVDAAALIREGRDSR